MRRQSTPSLTVFAQLKTGGVQSFYANLACSGAFRRFDAKFVLMDRAEDQDSRLAIPMEGAPSTVFNHTDTENYYMMLRRLARTLPKQGGVVFCNWHWELNCLDAFRRRDL